MTQLKTDIIEVLNTFNITESDHKNGSQLGYKKKYLLTCWLGRLHDVVNQLKNEYNIGSNILQDMNDEDNDMDSRGGYGRMAIERRQGYGFPTDPEKLSERLEVLMEDYNVIKECFDYHDEIYETLYGSKFSPKVKGASTTTNKAALKKAKKKFVPIA